MNKCPKNSIVIHFILLMLTAGIGNIFYYLSIRKQKKLWYQLVYKGFNNNIVINNSNNNSSNN